MTLCGNWAYVSLGVTGFQVVDISDPTILTYAGGIDVDDWAYQSVVDGDYVFLADDSAGLKVYKIRQEELDIQLNKAVSTSVWETTGTIETIEIITVEQGLVSWEVSADDGATWDRVIPDDRPHSFGTPGRSLKWRAFLNYSEAGGDPVVSQVYLRWYVDEVGVEEDPTIPLSFALAQNAPNPFQQSTTVRLHIPSTGGDVLVAVYDVAGRLVRTLESGRQSPGVKDVTWDGRDARGESVAAGVYFCRLVAPGYDQSRKMILLK